jgi:bifunctional non-homologous end joining protein LigD
MKINQHEIDISNREKVFFPEVGLTKGDLIEYYREIAETMLPHIKDYGLSMQRFPDGLKGNGWYEKDLPDYFPEWIKRVNVPKREGGAFTAPVIKNKAGLAYLADQAVITLHPYLARAKDLEHPDKMIYDLDPPEGTDDFDAVREAALTLHDLLEELDLKNWVQTTGSKGFHVIVPLDRKWEFDRVREFAKKAARVLVQQHEEKFTLEQRKDQRKGRIYLDTNRNSYGATAVAPYSLRAREEASIATPLDWDEVESGTNPREWTVKNIFNRLGQKSDPWKGMMRHQYSLESRMDNIQNMLDN